MRITAILLLTIFFCSWYSAGWWLLRGLGEGRGSGRHVGSLLAGMGVTGTLVALLGTMGLLNPLSCLALPGFFCLTGFFGPYRELSLRLYDIRRLRFSGPDMVLVLFLCIYLCRALVPPDGIDELMYHLSIPKLYLQHHGFFPVPWNPQADFPMLGEMNYLIAIACNNPYAPRCVAFAFGISALLALYLLSRQILSSRKHAFAAVLLFCAHTTVTANFSECNVDLLTSAFSLMALWYLIRAATNHEWRPLILCAIMSGFALQSKPFGIILVPLTILFIAFFFQTPWQQKLRQVLVYSAIALSLGALWYIKSMLFRGVPISQIATINPLHISSQIHQSVVVTLFYKLLLFVQNFLSAPWSYSLLPDLHRIDSFGPLFIAILPFAFFVKRSRRIYQLLFWAMGIWLAFILFSSLRGWHGQLSIRYMGVTIAIFCLLVVYVWENLRMSQIRLVIAISAIFWVGLSALVTVKRYRTDIFATISNQSYREYLYARYDLFPIIDYINTRLPDTCLVEADYCFGTYYLDVPYRCLQTGEDISPLALHNRGVTHVLTNNILDVKSNSLAWNGGKDMRTLFGANGYFLYEVLSEEKSSF